MPSKELVDANVRFLLKHRDPTLDEAIVLILIRIIIIILQILLLLLLLPTTTTTTTTTTTEAAVEMDLHKEQDGLPEDDAAWRAT